MPTFTPRKHIGDLVGYWVGVIEPDHVPPEPAPRTRGAFTIRLYDKDFGFRGWVGGYTRMTATPRHNAISTAQFSIPMTIPDPLTGETIRHPRLNDLQADGARVVIDYDGVFLMSGRVDIRDGAMFDDDAGGSALSVQVVGDLSYLWQILGWPNPTGGIDDQGAVSKFYIASGAAESVVKTLVSVNATRQGIPLTVYGSSGRGAVIKVKVRMDQLGDKLLPIVDQAGIGITIRQSGLGLVLDCYEPTVRTRVLSAASGVLTDATWTKTDPTATRVVIAGGGEGTDREFRWYVHKAREAQYGYVKELFVDAHDIGSDYEQAIKDVPDKALDVKKETIDLRKEQADYAVRASEYEAAVNRQDVAADRLLDMQDRLDDATDAVNDGPPSGTVHDNLVAAKTRATAAKARAVSAVASALSHFTTVSGYLATATTQLNAAQHQLDLAETAYDNAVTLRNTLRVQFSQDMADKAAEVFAETDAQYGLSLTLAETTSFRLWKTFKVGDSLPVEIDGTVVTEVCREATISDTVEGFSVTPTLGDPDNAATNNKAFRVVVRAVRSLFRDRRIISTGR